MIVNKKNYTYVDLKEKTKNGVEKPLRDKKS